MSKKTWILIASLVLSLTIGLGGSLAYLTDTDSKVNTFTMGNVDIEVEEDFDLWAAEHLKPGVNIRKTAKIANTGDNDAWVWMEIAVPVELRPYIELFGEWNDENRDPNYCEQMGVPVYDENGNVIDWDAWRRVTGDDNQQYDVITILVKDQLPAGESTRPLLFSVKLKDFVDKRSDGSWYYVENGHEEPINFNGTDFNIVVSGFAIQSDEGINNVHLAYQLYNNQWGDQKVPNISTADKDTWMVHNAQELQDLLNDDPNNKVITLADGDYDHVTLGNAENLTIRSAVNSSPVMHGITIETGSEIHGLWIENLEFNDKGIEFEFDKHTNETGWSHVYDLHVTNCEYHGEKTADGGSLVTIKADSPGSHQLHNVYIHNCRVYGAHQGIKLGGLAKDCKVEICNNYFEDINHNAISLRSGAGDILVEGNTIKNGGDRAFRIGDLSATGIVTYSNNNIENTGDPDDNTNFKANTIYDGATVVYNGETINGPQTGVVR